MEIEARRDGERFGAVECESGDEMGRKWGEDFGERVGEKREARGRAWRRVRVLSIIAFVIGRRKGQWPPRFKQTAARSHRDILGERCRNFATKYTVFFFFFFLFFLIFFLV